MNENILISLEPFSIFLDILSYCFPLFLVSQYDLHVGVGVGCNIRLIYSSYALAFYRIITETLLISMLKLVNKNSFL